VACLALLLAAAPACSKKKISVPAQSEFLGELSDTSYPRAEAPGGAQTFAWDFSKQQVFAYAFDQQVKNEADMGMPIKGAPKHTKQTLSGQGNLLVKSGGIRTATLVLDDLQVRMTADMGQGPKTMQQKAPPTTIQGMKEDGSAATGDSSQAMLIRLLFPLPSRPVKVGESAEAPIEMSFNASGKTLPVKGRSRTTLAGYVRIGERTCARFDSEIKISELDVPSGMPGEYRCEAKGRSVSFFDVKARCFVSGAVALLMHMEMDMKMPRMKGMDLPDRMRMEMVTDNLIRVKLKSARGATPSGG
jgi:hypothetical protein